VTGCFWPAIFNLQFSKSLASKQTPMTKKEPSLQYYFLSTPRVRVYLNLSPLLMKFKHSFGGREKDASNKTISNPHEFKLFLWR